MTLDLLRTLIAGYKLSCTASLPSPPGLILALDLANKEEYDLLKQQPALARELDRAELWMAEQWYTELAKGLGPSAGITFALKTMGFDVKGKGEKMKDTLHLHFHDGHDRL